MFLQIFPIVLVSGFLILFRIHTNGEQEIFDDGSTMEKELVDAERHIKPWIELNHDLSRLHGVR